MPLTIDLPPEVLAALRGRAAARGRTPQEEAAVAVAVSLDVLLHPPEPPGDPDDDWRDDPEAVAWVESVRTNVKQPPEPTAEQAEALAEFLASDPGVEDAGMSNVEWRAYWETLERDGEGRPDLDQSGRGDRPGRTDRAAA